MAEEKRDVLITYRIAQANETKIEAELLIAHEKYRAAMNRIYYGMFYAVSALAAQHDFSTSKHGQLIGWFNQTFIKSGRFDRMYGKMLREAFELRNQGDYDAFIEFSQADVLERLDELIAFIKAIETYLFPEQQKTPSDEVDDAAQVSSHDEK